MQNSLPAPGSAASSAANWITALRRRPTRLGYLAAVAAAACLQSACLSTSYEIPRGEVDRLVQLPPEARGQNIRAVQRFSLSRDLTPAQQWGPAGNPDGSVPPVVGAPITGGAPLYSGYSPNYYGYGSPYYGPHIWVGGGGGSSGTVAGGGGGGTAGVATGSGSKSFGSALGKADRDSARALAVIVIVAAVVIGAALAVSEGSRYDGFVAVHPHHPLHLLGPDGDRHVALDELRPGDVRDDETVILEGHDGAGMWQRGRAPLDRVGMVYAMGGGSSNLQLAKGTVVSGGMAEMAIGAFPAQWLGIVGRTQFIDGAQNGGDFIGLRAGGEVQLLPIALSRLHLGAYGGAGYEWAKGSGGDLPFTDESRLSLSAGGMLELEWTTRLAMYFRYGVASALLGQDRGEWLTGGALGLSIY